MLKPFLINLSKSKWMQRTFSNSDIARRAAGRFVPGETIKSALHAVQQLNQQGIYATLDYLGENTSTLQDADLATSEVLHLLDEIFRSSLSANVSIKLSQLGLSLDFNRCQENLVRILNRARDSENFIRIDMEDSSLTEPTITTYLKARQDFENVGLVIQAYLYRSKQDIQRITQVSGKVRLCKGAYQESPDLAFPKKRDVDINYDVLANDLLQSLVNAGSPQFSSNGRIPPLPAFATHDQSRIKYIISKAQEWKLPKSSFEFQMLFGIRRELQQELTLAGYPVRVYVPYGTHWYPYFMRRLAERPANVWFFTKAIFHK